jgi:plasmid stabilization system protein ParE
VSRFAVVWAEVAEGDLARVLDFLVEESPASASGALERIEAAAAALETFPRRGRIVPELKWYGIDRYREVQTPPWRLVYRVEAKQVVVVAVLDARRSLEDALLDRFLAL